MTAAAPNVAATTAAAVPDAIAARLAEAEAAARAKRFGEADGICRDLLTQHPGHPGALGLRGSIAAVEGNIALAIDLLEQAIAVQPNNINWLSTLGDMYRMACRLDEALALGQRTLQARPRHAPFLVSVAKTHADRGELDKALAHYLAALALTPEDANAHLGIAQILLARGEYRAGWIEYEWRNGLEQAKGRMPPIKAPMWNGMMLPEGRVLLIGDQGFGDTLQFARYIPMVAQRCREVVIAVAADLHGLMSTIDGVGPIHTRWKDVPGFSAYALMSSLPYIFGTETDSIPAVIPYLRSDPARVAHWRDRLAGLPASTLRVGLFWSGRPTHPNNTRRSIALSQLRALSAVPGVQFISLQKQLSRPDLAELAKWPSLHDVSADLHDFGETAALIENLDVVITVDSAVAHLAGALDRPVWIMLASPPDWRWRLETKGSAWYPSVCLFRQKQAGAWDQVVGSVAEALAKLYKSRQ